MSHRWHRFVLPIALASALNAGLLALFYWPRQKNLVGDESYYLVRAVEILAGQTPQHVPLWPALYSELLARLFGWFGVEALSVQVPQIGLWLLTAVLMGDVAAQALGSRVAAWAAFLLLLFSPELMAFSHLLWPETAHLFCFALALWLLVRGEAGWAGYALAGVALGVALLLKLLLAGFLPLLAGFLLLRGKVSLARRAAQIALLGSALALTILPTLLHNRELHGRFMIADSSAFNLWLGLTDQARSDHADDRADRAFDDFQAAGPNFAARSEAFRERSCALLRSRGWGGLLAGQLAKQYFRLLDHHGFFTTQLPGGPRAAYHFDAPALAAAIRAWAYGFHALLLAAGALGLAALRLRPLGWMHVWAAFLAYNLALFLFAHVKTRYFVQLVPALALAAGIAAHQLVDLLRGRGLSRNPVFVFTPARVAGGLAGAALLTWLAFHEALAP